MNRITRHLVLIVPPVVALFLQASPLQWEEGNGFRRAPLRIQGTGRTGFTALSPAEIGMDWTNTVSDEQVAKRYNMVSGGGVAAGDYDADGFCDLFFCNRSGENALFRNLGDGRFNNVTGTAGVGCPGQSSTGATFADVNGDGMLDLLVSFFLGPHACFLNAGGGRFINVTQKAGWVPRGGATSFALGDVDSDGDLDLYFTYFGVESILREGGRLSFGMINGQPVVTGRHARRLKIENGQLVELGDQDILYLNGGHARFIPVNWKEFFRDEAGQPIVSAPLDFGLSAQIRDINEDGYPDIYSCNDFQTPDRAWINDRQGHFHAMPLLALRIMSYASMGVDFADIDRDGHLDFLTLEMLSRDHAHRLRQLSSMPMANRKIGAIDDREAVPRNTLHWNRGDGTYAEIAWFSGVAASDWSWTPVFLDVDLDGYEDLLVSNGSLYDVMDLDAAAAAAKLAGPGGADPRKLLSLYPRLNNSNAAFRNRGDLTFEDVGRVWGFDSSRICQGMALADLDNDGDMDPVMNCANSPPLVCRNDSPAPRVAVRVKGVSPNSQGIGAKVKLFGGAVPMQSQEITAGGRYLSGDQQVRVFAAGSLTNQMRIEVIWRSGKRSELHGVQANWTYEINERAASAVSSPSTGVREPEPAPWFEDVTSLLGHFHHEEDFNDFERQPLLPRKLSQAGPAVAWHDLDADGWDDLIIGSGKGGRLAVFHNNKTGGFEPWRAAPWDESVTQDQTGIVAAGPWILAGSDNYENGTDTLHGARIYRAGAKSSHPGFPGQPSSTGPLALADLDGDGTLDLFVGGRVIPGRYPEAATSLVFRHSDGRWVTDVENSARLVRVGLVSGAVWSDLTGDGYPELILACEWGPLRVFYNEGGRLTELNLALLGAPTASLRDLHGWWNGVSTGDFDGDGRMDIVASNWGLNSSYRASPGAPRKIYYGDIAGRGQLELIEACYDAATRMEVPERDLNAVAVALPFVRGKFSSHAAYSQASIKDIYGDKLASLREVKATTLESMIFLNRGDYLEAVPLPAQAQFSPAFAACVGDVDGDGDEDVFLSQNFFATRPGASRLDAGRGLWLTGDGHGHFQCVPGQQSGIRVYGEQRGAALGDYDHDGRIDLVVTQNGAASKLFRNVRAKPGLRIRLHGPPGNPAAVGAQLRLEQGEWKGPIREIHAGSGYWSQDSAVAILSAPERATTLWVRWPGGKVTTTKVPSGAKEIQVDSWIKQLP